MQIQTIFSRNSHWRQVCRPACTSHPLGACGLTPILHNIRIYKKWTTGQRGHPSTPLKTCPCTFQQEWDTVEVFALDVFSYACWGIYFFGSFFKRAFPAVSDWKQSKPLLFKLQISQRWIKNPLKLLHPDHSCSKDSVSYIWYRCALEFINTHRGEVHSVIAPHRGVQSVGSKDRKVKVLKIS